MMQLETNKGVFHIHNDSYDDSYPTGELWLKDPRDFGTIKAVTIFVVTEVELLKYFLILDSILIREGALNYPKITIPYFSGARSDGESVNLHKDPVTDNGLKKSATGRVAVLRNKENNRAYYLYDNAPDAVLENSHLKTVWKDGKFVQSYTFNEIRNRLHPEGF